MRAAIFIDGGYILSQCKHQNIQPDYSQLTDYLLEPIAKRYPIDLLRCYFYYCAPWMSQDPTKEELRRMEAHDQFIEEMRGIDRWAVKLGKLEKRRGKQKEYFEQKRVDVLLSCDMVRHAAAGHIQHAILIAGDSDFIPAVEATKESGTTVTLWCGDDGTVHKDLVNLSDEVKRFDWQSLPKLSPKTSPKKKVSKNSPKVGSKRKSTKKRTKIPKKEPSTLASVPPPREEISLTQKIASRLKKMRKKDG